LKMSQATAERHPAGPDGKSGRIDVSARCQRLAKQMANVLTEFNAISRDLGIPEVALGDAVFDTLGIATSPAGLTVSQALTVAHSLHGLARVWEELGDKRPHIVLRGLASLLRRSQVQARASIDLCHQLRDNGVARIQPRRGIDPVGWVEVCVWGLWGLGSLGLWFGWLHFLVALT
jgi:hypothetical protein